MKHMKRSSRMRMVELCKSVIEKYEREHMEMTEQCVKKCMEDIIEKEFVREEGEFYVYT